MTDSLDSDLCPVAYLVFLLISNLTNGLHLHQFLGTKTTVLERPFPFLEHPLLF